MRLGQNAILQKRSNHETSSLFIEKHLFLKISGEEWCTLQVDSTPTKPLSQSCGLAYMNLSIHLCHDQWLPASISKFLLIASIQVHRNLALALLLLIQSYHFWLTCTLTCYCLHDQSALLCSSLFHSQWKYFPMSLWIIKHNSTFELAHDYIR